MDRSFTPPPWKLDGDVIRDASGGVVISAFNPCNTAVRKMIVERMEAEDVMQGFWDHPAREIVRRAVGEWEDA